jgi:predicted SAM-dependent methyltransferase
MKLNLGCGPVQPEGWVNVDGSNRAWLASRLPWIDRICVSCKLFAPTDFNPSTVWANLLKRFPWDDRSVQAVYLGEILEHFTREEGEGLLRECHRVLELGGVIRVRVPDDAAFWGNYVREYEATRRLPRTQWSSDHTRWTRMHFQEVCTTRPKPWRSMGHYHKFGYDDVSLILLLEKIGFREVDRRRLHESRIDDIQAVENRYDLIVEGIA